MELVFVVIGLIVAEVWASSVEKIENMRTVHLFGAILSCSLPMVYGLCSAIIGQLDLT